MEPEQHRIRINALVAVAEVDLYSMRERRDRLRQACEDACEAIEAAGGEERLRLLYQSPDEHRDMCRRLQACCDASDGLGRWIETHFAENVENVRRT